MKYRTDVDLTNQNSSQAAIARAIIASAPPGAKILDVGCAAGDLGAVLHDRGFVVTGIEADEEAAVVASGRIDAVVLADLEATSLADLVDGHFDVIIFGDVLEHLKDPHRILNTAVDLLTPRGFVMTSIPNVAHGAVRLALLQGRWAYTDEGLLDQTHLRFFTLESMAQMLQEADLVIDELCATVLDPLDAGVEIDDAALPGDIVEWVRSQEGEADFQYVARSHVAASSEAAPDRIPEVVRLALVPHPDDIHAARRADRIYAREVAERRASQLENLESERNRMLISRDNARALEAETGRLRYEVQRRDDDLHEVRTELIQTHARLAAALEDASAAHRRLNALPHNLVRRAGSKVLRKIGLR